MSSSEAVSNLDGATPVFEYIPFAQPEKEIRLLHITKVDGDHVSGELEIVSSQRSAKYFALSYCWGSGVQDETINLDGKPFQVTSNLLGAIKASYRFLCRKKKKSTRIWIDQICINQNDTEEKSRQVKRMSDIYWNAERTLIWLGPERDDSAKIMLVLKWLKSRLSPHRTGTMLPDKSFKRRGTSLQTRVRESSLAGLTTTLRRKCDLEGKDHEALTRRLSYQYGVQKKSLEALYQLLTRIHDDEVFKGRSSKEIEERLQAYLQETFLKKNLFPYDDPFWKAFQEANARDWFGRVWTYQEFALSNTATVLCGEYDVDWRIFGYCRSRLFDSDFTRILYPILNNEAVLNALRQSIYTTMIERGQFFPENALSVLLSISSYRQASNRRDYVYGILGLAGKLATSLIPVDYDLPTSTVFKVTTKFICQQSPSNWCSLMQDYIDTPISSECQSGNLPSWCPDFSNRSQNLHGYRGTNRKDLEISARSQEDWEGLVNVVFEEGADVMAVSGVRLDIIKTVAKPPLRYNQALNSRSYEQSDSETRTEQILQAICGRDRDMDLLDWFKVMSSLILSNDTRESKQQYQLRTYLMRDQEATNTMKRKVTFDELVAFCERVSSPTRLNSEDRVCEFNGDDLQQTVAGVDNVLLWQRGRYFFETDSGRWGLAVKEMSPGDHVCFIPGADCVFVLSPDCKKLIACASVQGLMGDVPSRKKNEWMKKMETFRLE